MQDLMVEKRYNRVDVDTYTWFWHLGTFMCNLHRIPPYGVSTITQH
jgi:hypothetical protein